MNCYEQKAQADCVLGLSPKNATTLQQGYTNMYARIVALEAEKSDLEKEVANTVALAESLRAECAQAQKKAADLEAKNRSLGKMTLQHAQRIESLKGENTLLREEIDKIRSSCSFELVKTVEGTLFDLQSLRKEGDTIIASLKKTGVYDSGSGTFSIISAT